MHDAGEHHPQWLQDKIVSGDVGLAPPPPQPFSLDPFATDAFFPVPAHLPQEQFNIHQGVSMTVSYTHLTLPTKASV